MFVILFAGFIVVGAALVTEIALSAAVSGCTRCLWLPLILIVTLGPLRPIKGLMIALQFTTRPPKGGSTGASHEQPPPAALDRAGLGAAADRLADRRFAVLIALGTWQLAAQGLEGRPDRDVDRAARRARRALTAARRWPRLDAATTTNSAA